LDSAWSELPRPPGELQQLSMVGLHARAAGASSQAALDVMGALTTLARMLPFDWCALHPFARPCQRAELGRCFWRADAHPQRVPSPTRCEAEAVATATGAVAAAAKTTAAPAAEATPTPMTALAALAAAAAVAAVASALALVTACLVFVCRVRGLARARAPSGLRWSVRGPPGRDPHQKSTLSHASYVSLGVGPTP